MELFGFVALILLLRPPAPWFSTFSAAGVGAG
jgi:hypothetical protein